MEKINLETLVADIKNVSGDVVNPTVEDILHWGRHTNLRSRLAYWSHGKPCVGGEVVTGKVFNRQLDINYIVNVVDQLRVSTIPTNQVQLEDDDEYW